MSAKLGVGIRALLAGDADVLTELGNPPRFYPNMAKQNPVQPYAVYQIVSGTDVLELTQTSELIESRIQIDVYDDDYIDAHEAMSIIRKAIKDQSGTYGGVEIKDIYPDGSFRDGIGNLPDGSETKIHVVSQDFNVWHYRGDDS